MFAGGWLSPLEGTAILASTEGTLLGSFLGSGLHWFVFKVAFFAFLFLWFRATFPRYRYDQIMRLGWKVFIPVTIVWIVVVGVAILMGVGPWFEGVPA